MKNISQMLESGQLYSAFIDSNHILIKSKTASTAAHLLGVAEADLTLHTSEEVQVAFRQALRIKKSPLDVATRHVVFTRDGAFVVPDDMDGFVREWDDEGYVARRKELCGHLCRDVDGAELCVMMLSESVYERTNEDDYEMYRSVLRNQKYELGLIRFGYRNVDAQAQAELMLGIEESEMQMKRISQQQKKVQYDMGADVLRAGATFDRCGVPSTNFQLRIWTNDGDVESFKRMIEATVQNSEGTVKPRVENVIPSERYEESLCVVDLNITPSNKKGVRELLVRLNRNGYKLPVPSLYEDVRCRRVATVSEALEKTPLEVIAAQVCAPSISHMRHLEARYTSEKLSSYFNALHKAGHLKSTKKELKMGVMTI
ncbi:hypothetical protein AB4254_08500 [Vibrio breoganii]